MNDLYKDLNIDKNADEQTIKKEYRNYCKNNHPDVGGDTEDFRDKKNKYAVLLCPTRRKKYDETGDTTEEDQQNKLYSNIMQIFLLLIQRDSNNIDDDINLMKENAFEQLESQENEVKTNIEKTQKFIDRIVLKNKDKENTVLTMLKQTTAQMELKLTELKNQKELQTKIFKYLKDNFEYINETGEIPDIAFGKIRRGGCSRFGFDANW
jgi:DnaJ-class molecular chaperone